MSATLSDTQIERQTEDIDGRASVRISAARGIHGTRCAAVALGATFPDFSNGHFGQITDATQQPK
jgi:hypothetical protein